LTFLARGENATEVMHVKMEREPVADLATLSKVTKPKHVRVPMKRTVVESARKVQHTEAVGVKAATNLKRHVRLGAYVITVQYQIAVALGETAVCGRLPAIDNIIGEQTI
jgi:hypothetical protein